MEDFVSVFMGDCGLALDVGPLGIYNPRFRLYLNLGKVRLFILQDEHVEGRSADEKLLASGVIWDF